MGLYVWLNSSSYDHLYRTRWCMCAEHCNLHDMHNSCKVRVVTILWSHVCSEVYYVAAILVTERLQQPPPCSDI